MRAATPAALGAIPLRLIERHRVCPFRLEEGHVRLATLVPRDRARLREIGSATGLVVEPWITIEPRLYQALNLHFQLQFEIANGIALPRGPGDGLSMRKFRLTTTYARGPFLAGSSAAGGRSRGMH